ncbi:hypothetical protein ACFL3O_00325 [Candidatus Neomarinimicrobiota bacterium]
MTYFKKTILPIILIGLWINISITIGWMLILEGYWIAKFQSINLVFPTGLINNITWMIWGFMLATIIFIFSKKFSLWQTTFLAWFVAFVMMWAIVWNVGVLPTGMLLFNIPNSLFITFIGTLICKRLTK